jgi:hypothetical protein
MSDTNSDVICVNLFISYVVLTINILVVNEWTVQWFPWPDVSNPAMTAPPSVADLWAWAWANLSKLSY